MKDLVYNFIRQHQLAVISTIGSNGKPEAALIGIAVSGNLDIIFDTLKTSRKYNNILSNPHIAIVVGWDNDTTIQYEGIAEVLGDDNFQIITGKPTTLPGPMGGNAPKPGRDSFISK